MFLLRNVLRFTDQFVLLENPGECVEMKMMILVMMGSISNICNNLVKLVGLRSIETETSFDGFYCV